jgi:hypothetical protein
VLATLPVTNTHLENAHENVKKVTMSISGENVVEDNTKDEK